MRNQYIFLLIVSFLCIHTMGMESLSEDIIRHRIQPYLSFQDISYVKQASSVYDKLFDCDSNFNYSVYACARLEKNYYACTQALVYCAIKNDKEKFKDLLKYDEDIRNAHADDIIKKHSIDKLMQFYKHRYNKKKNKIYNDIINQGSKYLISASETFDQNKIDNAYRLFSCIEGLGLYDLLINAGYKKNSIPLYSLAYEIFDYACKLNKVDLIALLCGGCVTQWSLHFIMLFASSNLLIKLIRQNILSSTAVDDEGKSLLHYAAECGYSNVVEVALNNGAYVNCCDSYKMMPLHYATKYRKKHVVEILIQDPNINISHVDDYGKTAFDYVRKDKLNFPIVKKQKKEIRCILRPYVETARINKQLIKSHNNGYQKLR